MHIVLGSKTAGFALRERRPRRRQPLRSRAWRSSKTLELPISNAAPISRTVRSIVCSPVNSLIQSSIRRWRAVKLVGGTLLSLGQRLR